MSNSSLRITLIICSSFLFLNLVSAQGQNKWADDLMSKEKTFIEIQEKFNSEWQDKEYEKGKGWKQFKRWENFWQNRLMPNGSFPEFSSAFAEYNSFTSQFSSSSSSAGNWLPLGPFEHITTGSWSSGTGRVNVVVQDPNNANTIYAGAPAGGIWKSTNSGSSWLPLGDFFSVIGISGIAVDFNDSNIIYVTTGDADAGDTYSIGIWKSTDGGITWTESNNGFNGQGNKILTDPNNSNIVWAASTGGLFKSINAGGSWNQVLTNSIRDIALKPNNSQSIYAVTSSECFYSNNGGTSFSSSTGLPGGTNRLAITVTPANPNVAYILAADESWAFEGVYKSTDSAVSFTAQNTTTDIFNGSGQAWYDMAVTVSDTEENTLFSGVLNVWRSTDGGVSWTEINSWSNPSDPSYTHADIHYLNFYNGNFYCGSDGGVYRSTDHGDTFTDLSDGLQIGQYYTIAGSINDANVICGGLQDNGGYAYTNGSWKCYYGADGMGSAVNPNNSNQIWGMIQNGSLYYSTDGGFNLNGVGSPQGGNWVTPMVHDPNTDRIIAGYANLYEYVIGSGWNQISTHDFGGNLEHVEVFEGNSNTIYVSRGSNLYKTTDGGISFTTKAAPGSITSIEINPTDSDELWITLNGWNDGEKIYNSTDGGTSWNNISINLPNLPTNIVKYRTTDNSLYLGMDIGVYYFNEVLGSWIPFIDNLPNVIVNDLEINENSGIIRAGTYGRGVWESGLYNSVQVDLDAMLISINKPTGNYCGELTEAEITFRNLGTVDILSLDIVYNVDGGVNTVYNWTGNLAPGENQTLNLDPFNSTNGNHVFNVILENPNGLTDQNTNNNAGNSSYSTVLVGDIVTLTLETDCWGGEVSWILVNELNETLYSAGAGTIGSETTTTWDFCLADGCYDFIISDSYGDGMNGIAFGCAVNGNYYINDSDGNVLVQMADPAYGSGVTENFCLGQLTGGCIDPQACNFDSGANTDNGSCDYSCAGCTDSEACNYDPSASIDNGSCDFSCYGCTDFQACNFNNVATIDDDSCDYSCYGCTNPNACNYDQTATIENGTCTFPINWYLDSDNDGFGDDNFTVNQCSQPLNFVSVAGDCNPVNSEIYPGATEICDGLDNDCDGNVDEGITTSTFYEDLDEDGFGSENSIESCQASGDFTATVSGDCDDTDANINPNSDEICGNSIDDNCNDLIDENQEIYYLDTDLDGFGDPLNTILACSASSGISENNLDCNDMNANMYPGASGTNEGLDNNCDGEITGDETEPCAGDWDDDGYITISDLVMMLADYGCTSNCSTDLNGDGHVSSSDITFFLSLFGSTCE